jgi:hypothetical protein
MFRLNFGDDSRVTFFEGAIPQWICMRSHAGAWDRERKKGIDQSLCIKYGECVVTCPMEYEAIKKISPPELAPIIDRPTE